jgi:HSP20 family protein
VELDLRAVDIDSVNIDVEANVLTVRAERPRARQDSEMLAAERPRGVFQRQHILGDSLRVQASYNAGVLALRIPIAEKAKPRRSKSRTAPARIEKRSPCRQALPRAVGGRPSLSAPD